MNDGIMFFKSTTIHILVKIQELVFKKSVFLI